MSRKTFPLRLDSEFSDIIDWCVFHTKTASKHQYIMEAIIQRVNKDKSQLKYEIEVSKSKGD